MDNQISELVRPIREDLLSGAAELALRAITIIQTILAQNEHLGPDKLKQLLAETVTALLEAQPAMAPLFHLGNAVLLATADCTTVAAIEADCQAALNKFERTLCESASAIADHAYALVPPGELVFAYSFSSTVVSMLLNTRAKGRYFRVACTESRPSQEGRKLATQLAAGNIEVIYTFDSAMGLVLPNCAVAFMGCDCIGRPGIVNKVGSYLLALTCKEMGVPLYALAGTEKIVGEDRLFEFEKHERPGEEVWDVVPKGVRVLNHQFELVPFSLVTGVVTENGVLKEKDIEKLVEDTKIHESLKLETVTF